MAVKPVTFHGDALERLRDFPDEARRDAGHELYQLQMGRDPSDWKPMPTIGAGVREIRIHDATGAYRVIYIATFSDAIHVLHAFEKKTQKTAPSRPGACNGTPAADQARIGMTRTSTFANVWDAIEDSPEEAATMTMRSNVMIAIKDQVRSWNTTQANAARRLAITQPRLNDLLNGKINKFSLDTLLTLATRAGLKVKLDVRSAA
jgi:phage-related protein/predicted XRE-type DNA-binding protein